MKGKVVLVKPLNDVCSTAIPLGLLHIGTSLEAKGYRVKIVDANKDPNYKVSISQELNDAVYVGITCLTTEIKSALEISDYVKEHSNVPVVWGGWHPTLFPEQTCADKSVDFVCIREGDDVAVQLAESLESGRSVEQIAGLAFKKDGTVKVNPPKGYVDVEKLPLTNYDLIDLSKYNLSAGIEKHRMLPYLSSRGCPHRCGFCINTVSFNNVWRAKSPKKTVDEIEILTRKYGLDGIGFLDDNFFVSKQRVTEICKEILARKLEVTWFAESRADYFDRFDQGFLDLCVKSGLRWINIGAESGSDRMLKILDKDITTRQVLESAKILSKYQITPTYCFLAGVPSETKDDLDGTVKLMQRIRKICPTAKYNVGLLTPYPKCKLTDSLIADGMFKEPSSLREWATDKNRKLYTDRTVGKPWHTNPRFLSGLSYFSGLAYETLSDQQIRLVLKKLDLIRFPRVLFVFLARLRMKLGFYDFPVERILNSMSAKHFKRHVQEGKY